jgi:protein disulfide-isomerase A6
MKPAWDKLGDNFKDSKTVLIGDVDCTIHKGLCSRFGVRGYPTIKYFTGATASDGDKYEGGRDYDSLKTFAEENLGPSCSVDNKDLCDDDQLALINAAEAMSVADLKTFVKEKETAIEDAETNFKSEVEKLQASYQELMANKDATIKAASANLRYYRSVANSKA